MTTSKDQNQGCLTAILQVFGRKPKPEKAKHGKSKPQKCPYQLKETFLSYAELVFYKQLSLAVPPNVAILIKTRLADIFKIDRSIVPYSSESRLYFNKISQKHVDFLLCHADTMNPLVGIELDDSSHQKPDRVSRDELVDNIFEAANLPLVRIQVQSTYDKGEIARLLSPFWESSTPPNCPKCDQPMLIRTAKSGEHQGVKFYVCPDTKNCRTYFPA
ncbi:MAG: DUF2726 domain-containing protein [Anaerolineales bacterium]|nr:DUF2726 domain-containing protein [Anaerolineales bacterium]